MKKIPFLLLSLLFFILVTTSSLRAQRFNGGVMLGFDASQVDGDTYEGYNKWGFLGGGYVGLRLSPHSSFQMELEYIQKGARGVDTLVSGHPTLLVRLNYIEIPVLYKFTFRNRFYFEAGPAADISIGSKEFVDGIEAPDPRPLRAVSLTGIFGFGVYATKHLHFDTRFNYSLLSIRNGTYNGYRRILFEVGQYNNVLSLTAFWDFKAREF